MSYILAPAKRILMIESPRTFFFFYPICLYFCLYFIIEITKNIMDDQHLEWLSLFKGVDKIFPRYTLNQSFNLRPKQMQSLDCLVKGTNVIAVLPTGFGKSLIFHLLPFVMPKKSATGNIVLVILLHCLRSLVTRWSISKNVS